MLSSSRHSRVVLIGGLGGNPWILSVLVPLSPVEVIEPSKKRHSRDNTVEEIKVAAVEVLPLQPPRGTAAVGDPVHQPHQQRAQQRRHPGLAPEEGHADGLHAVGRLAGEELEQPHEGGGVGHADQEELRRQPEDGDLAAGRHRVLPLPLDHRRDGRGDGRGQEAHGDALQLRDPARVPRAPPHQRHQHPVVGHQHQRLEDGRDDEEHRRVDVHLPQLRVRRHALLDGERDQQRRRYVRHRRAEDERQHA